MKTRKARNPFSIAADIIDPPDDHWKPLPHQIPPAGQWFLWMLLGGRGSGKTAVAARYMHEHINGPPCLPGVAGGHWASIVAPTLGDAVTCVTGPSGIQQHDRNVKVRTTPGGTVARFPNGAEVKLFGAHNPEDVERFRAGGNRCFVWLEEMAAWRYLEESFEQIRFGLRVGPRPHAVASTTPKNRRLIKKIKKDSEDQPDKYKLTTATTHDNPYLHEERKQEIIDDYGDSRLGRQEIYAEILEDIEGALWNMGMIDPYRLDPLKLPDTLNRVVVGVDPQAKEGGDDTGVVVVGRTNWWDRDPRPHGHVLGDYTTNGRPEEWARMAIRAYKEHRADIVVAEINNGGDMVVSTLRQVDPTVPVKVVHASRGKATRAEPVSTLYEQGRMHHIGEFPALEDQMCEWDAMDPDPDWSPDRMDALVWASSELLVKETVASVVSVKDRRLAGRR